jgi:hypothetical protein
VSYTILALTAFALAGFVLAWRRRHDVPLRTLATVAAVLLGWSIVVGNAFDYRENNRFRVEAAPLLLVLAAIGIELTIRAASARRRARHDATMATPAPAP